MITRCEIISPTGPPCDAVATSWCRSCDRATCELHGPRRGENVDRARCTSCSAAAAEAERTAISARDAALADITDSIRALRRQHCAATELACTPQVRRSWWRPWTRRRQTGYSLRYWPVGTFTWVESCPGGFGEHELVLLGVGDYETVVNERGQITRRDEREILAGRPVLAQLLSEPAATVSIAAVLRGYLR